MGSFLVRYTDNYADEFDVEGFTVYNKDEYKQFNENLKQIQDLIDSGKTVEFYFGDNEYIEYSKQWNGRIASAFNCEEISGELGRYLKKLFNIINSYGIFFDIGEYLEYNE